MDLLVVFSQRTCRLSPIALFVSSVIAALYILVITNMFFGLAFPSWVAFTVLIHCRHQ